MTGRLPWIFPKFSRRVSENLLGALRLPAKSGKNANSSEYETKDGSTGGPAPSAVFKTLTKVFFAQLFTAESSCLTTVAVALASGNDMAAMMESTVPLLTQRLEKERQLANMFE